MPTYQLSIVKRHQHTEGSNTDACDKASCNDVGVVLQESLNNDTDSKDHTRNNDGPATSRCISKITIDQSTNPGTKLQNSCEESTGDTIAARLGVPGFHLRGQSESGIAGI